MRKPYIWYPLLVDPRSIGKSKFNSQIPDTSFTSYVEGDGSSAVLLQTPSALHHSIKLIVKVLNEVDIRFLPSLESLLPSIQC